MLRKTLAASVAALALVAAPALAADYKIGLLMPKSGPLAALGEEMTNGFNLAVEHFGAELGEHTLTVVEEDTETRPQPGLQKMRKLVLQDEVDVVTGIASSAVLAAVQDFAHQSQTPIVVANAGNDLATGERCSPYVVRVSFSNSQVNRPIGPYLFEQGVRRIYTLAADYAAGHQMIETFAREFKAAGGEIVGGQFTPFGQTSDFGPFLTAARASEPDGIFVFYAGREAISFVQQYDSFGLKESTPLYGSGWLVSAAYVNAQGAAADGIVTALNYVPTIDNPENARFQADYQAQFGRVGSEFAVQGYDAGRLIIEAIKKAGDDKDKLAEKLPKVKFNGPRGPLEIDPATNNVVQNIYIYKTNVTEAGASQQIMDVVEAVRDPANGCGLG